MSLTVMRRRKRVGSVSSVVDRSLVVCHRVSRVLTLSFAVGLLKRTKK